MMKLKHVRRAQAESKDREKSGQVSQVVTTHLGAQEDFGLAIERS